MNFSKMGKVMEGDIVRIRETVAAADTKIVDGKLVVKLVPANDKHIRQHPAIVRAVFDCEDASQGQIIFADVYDVPKDGESISLADVEKLPLLRPMEVFSREQVRPLARPVGENGFYGFE